MNLLARLKLGFFTVTMTFISNTAQADVAPPDACYALNEPCTWDSSGGVGTCRKSTCERARPDGSVLYECLRCVVGGGPSDASVTTTREPLDASRTQPSFTSDAASTTTVELVDAIAPAPVDAAVFVDANVTGDASVPAIDASVLPDASMQIDASTNPGDAATLPDDAGDNDEHDSSDTDCNCNIPGSRREQWLSGLMLSVGLVALGWARRSHRT